MEAPVVYRSLARTRWWLQIIGIFVFVIQRIHLVPDAFQSSQGVVVLRWLLVLSHTLYWFHFGLESLAFFICYFDLRNLFLTLPKSRTLFGQMRYTPSFLIFHFLSFLSYGLISHLHLDSILGSVILLEFSIQKFRILPLDQISHWTSPRLPRLRRIEHPSGLWALPRSIDYLIQIFTRFILLNVFFQLNFTLFEIYYSSVVWVIYGISSLPILHWLHQSVQVMFLFNYVLL